MSAREVSDSRRAEVDAAIVRVMKARKRLGHNDLIAELFKLLQFEVTRLEPFGLSQNL